MASQSKDVVAATLARHYFSIDSGVTRIFRITSPNREDRADEPIKLLEIYEHAIPSGIVPIHFSPHPASGLTFPAEIVQIAPEELEQVESEELPLPADWRIGFEYTRPVAAERAGR